MDQPRRKVVLVEDDPDARHVLARALRGKGFEVLQAGDGELGLSLIARNRPDLVCLDISLPHISGFDVCEMVRANMDIRHARILIITGRSTPQDRAIAETVGADGYLTKPFSIAAFTGLVERLMQAEQEPVPLSPKVHQ